MINDNNIILNFIKNGKLNSKKLSKNYLLNHNDELNYLLNRYLDNYTINNVGEIIYRIVNNIDNTPLCICGKRLIYYGFHKGYSKHCCAKCSANDSVVKEKLKESNLKKYGVEYPNLSKIVRDKTKQTNLEKYGVENVYLSLIIKDKIKQTNLAKYGAEYPALNYIIRDKLRHTNLAKYGQTAFNKNAIETTFIQKYGVTNCMKIQEVKEKLQNTMFDRYGQYTSWNNGILREKQYLTCLEKYGSKFYTQTNEFKEWNSEHMKLPEIQKKILETKRKNHSFHTSTIEKLFIEYLNKNYLNDFIHQYKSELYPFNCDFYIKSLNLYIEIQGDWRHGFHPFDENNLDDLLRLKYLKDIEYEKLIINKQKKTDYTNAINTWIIRDPQKRKCAKDNNLNYLEIFSNNINEVIQIFEEYINNLNN